MAGTKIVTMQAMLGCPLAAGTGSCESCGKYFDCTSDLKQSMYDSPALRKIARKMENVKYKIAVMSGKGGVGKSTTTANLAAAFHLMGARVGIIDSDFYGPSIPTLMGVLKDRLEVNEDGMVPVVSSHGIKVASVGSTLNESDVVTWMGEYVRWGLYQFLGGTDWGELDLLLIDLPPGTGEETLNVMKALPMLSGGVIVTIPSEVSQLVVARGILLCQKAKTNIFGLIENMGSLVCPSCNENVDVFSRGGGKKVADKMGVPFLGTIPLDQRVASASDTGMPFVLKFPESDAAQEFMRIARDIASELGFEPTATETSDKAGALTC